jgi:hypothetical protein
MVESNAALQVRMLDVQEVEREATITCRSAIVQMYLLVSAMRLVMGCVGVCPRFHFRFRLSSVPALFFVLTRI